MWLLHGILMPLNAYRLLEAWQPRRRARSAPVGSPRAGAARRSGAAYASSATTVGRRGWASSQTITSSAFRSGGNTG